MEGAIGLLRDLIDEINNHLDDNPQLSTYLQTKIEVIIEHIEVNDC